MLFALSDYQGDPPLTGFALSFGFYALIVLWLYHAVRLSALNRRK